MSARLSGSRDYFSSITIMSIYLLDMKQEPTYAARLLLSARAAFRGVTGPHLETI
jgi:hypothetical protein